MSAAYFANTVLYSLQYVARSLHGEDDLDAHVFPLMHELAVDEDLVGTDAVADRVCRVRDSGDLYLAPFAVRGHETALGGAVLELAVDALLVDTALSLDEGRL